MLTHRSVYEEIQKKFPELEYDVPRNFKQRNWAFYNTRITEEMRLLPGESKPRKVRFYRSEDYAFSWLAKQVGFEPCVNMNLLLGHVGNHTYSWFDRPALQKILLETFEHPMHSMERVKNE